MNIYDLLVAGAGPSGSYTALCTAKAGLRTLLVDRQRFPRYKPCGGILEGRNFEKYAPELVGYEENISYYTSFYYNYRKYVTRPLKSYIFNRYDLDKMLVDLAVDSGAEFLDGFEVTSFEKKQNFINIYLKNKAEKLKINAKLCIGADGVNSRVRQLSGLDRSRPKHSKIVTLVIPKARPNDDRTLEVTTEYGKTAIATFFFSGFLGFAWLAPGKNTVNVGIGTSINHANMLRTTFEDFLAQFGLEHELENASAYTIPLKPVKQLHSDRVLLVGDAAGMVDPCTGGGINLGFFSGSMAAKTAFKFIRHEIEDLGYYQNYMRNMLKTLTLKSNLINLINWFFEHKITSPKLEIFFLKRLSPMV